MRLCCQDSRRINQEEIDRLEFEKNSRARLHKLARERAVAEASGVAQMAGLQEQLSAVEARLNQLKQQLYFPDVKGYKWVTQALRLVFLQTLPPAAQC